MQYPTPRHKKADRASVVKRNSAVKESRHAYAHTHAQKHCTNSAPVLKVEPAAFSKQTRFQSLAGVAGVPGVFPNRERNVVVLEFPLVRLTCLPLMLN